MLALYYKKGRNNNIKVFFVFFYCFAQVFKERHCYQVLLHSFDSNILYEIIFINFVLRLSRAST